MNNNPAVNRIQEEQEIDLLDLFFFYWTKKWILLLALLLGALAAGIITHYFIAPTFASTSKLYVFSSNKGAIDFSELQLSTNLTNDYLELIKSRPVVETVNANLGNEYDYEHTMKMLKVENPTSTRFLNITITSTDPAEARDMANEFAEVTKSQISAIMKQDEQSVVEKAVLPQKKVAPSLSRNTALGGLIVLVIFMGIYLLLYLLDDTIKSEEDVEKYLGVNTLAVIPLREGEKSTKRGIRSVFRARTAGRFPKKGGAR